MMFMNIAATNTVLTTTFWLTARTGKANFTNYYKSMETSAVPAAPGAIRVTFRQAGRVDRLVGCGSGPVMAGPLP